MGPVGNQRKMIAFLAAWLAVTASGTVSAQSDDSKWNTAPVEEVPRMDVKMTAPNAKLVDNIMVDKLLAEVDLNDGNFASAIVSLKDVIRRLSKVLPADDMRVLSSNYALAYALERDGKNKQANAILKSAMKRELVREKTEQQKDRKYISEAERSSDGMETVAEFESRYTRAERLIEDDVVAAMLERSMILFWNGRQSDALRLASIYSPIDRKSVVIYLTPQSKARAAHSLYVQGLCCFAIGDMDGLRKSSELYKSLVNSTEKFQTEPLVATDKILGLKGDMLRGLAVQSEKHYDEAQKTFEDTQKKLEDALLKGDNVPSKSDSNSLNRLDLNLLKLYLGNNFLFKGEPLKAYEVFERVYEEARRLDKGKPDSVVYADVYFAALGGMRSSVLTRYTMSMGSEFTEIPDDGSSEVPKFSSHVLSPADTASGEQPAVPLTEFEYRRLAGDLNTVAYQYKLKKQQRVARELFYRALNVYEKHLPNYKREIAGLLYDLAESYYWSKQNDAAIGVMKKCVAVRKEMDPVSHDSMASLNQLGRMYQSNGEGKEAVKCFREALALLCREKEMGKSRVYRLAADVGLQTNPIKLAHLADDDKDQSISAAVREKLSSGNLRRMLDTTYDADNIPSVCNWPLTRQLNAVAYAVSSSPPSERNELNDLWQVLADAYNIGKHYDESYETSLSLLQSRKQSAQTPIDPADLTDNLWQLAYICSVSYRLQEAKQYFDDVVKHHKPMNERTTGYLHYVRGLVNDSNGLPKEAVADFRVALKCLKNYLPTLHPLDEAEEIDHTRWLIYDIEQEIKAKRKRGPDAPDYFGAYESTQWTRDRFPLKICIDQTKEHGFGPRLLSSFKQSIDDWMSASKLTDDSPLSYRLIGDKEKADIYLERVDSWDQIPYGSGGGATARHVMRDGKLTNDLDLVHLRVYCKTPDPEEMSNYEIAQLEGLVLHELGHAFGLGHSSSGLDIMYWKSAAKNLTHRDKATLLRIYGCQAKRQM